VLVRERADADLPACVQLARAVHERDGYPHYLPGDLREFLVLPDAYGGVGGGAERADRGARRAAPAHRARPDGTGQRGDRAILGAVRAAMGDQVAGESSCSESRHKLRRRTARSR